MPNTDVRPLEVLLPVAARLERPGRDARNAWVWETRTVEVPYLTADERSIVGTDGFTAYAAKGIKHVRGACVGDTHWREFPPQARTTSGAFSPFAFVDEKRTELATGDRLLTLDHANPNDTVRDTIVPLTSPDVVKGSTQVASSFGLTVKVVAMAIRTMNAQSHGGAYEAASKPWDVHPAVRSTPLADGFMAVLEQTVRDRIALVDGAPMLRSHPPVIIVRPARILREIRVGVGYADLVEHPSGVDCVTTFPLDAGDAVEEELARAVAPGGAFEGWRLNLPAHRYGPLGGHVAAPHPETGAILPPSIRKTLEAYDRSMRTHITTAWRHGVEDHAELVAEIVASVDGLGDDPTARETNAVTVASLLTFRSAVLAHGPAPVPEPSTDVLDGLPSM